MDVTIIPSDGLVIVDGRAIDGIDMSGLPSDLHAVQYHPDLGVAEEEWRGEEANTYFTDIAKYQTIIARWQAEADDIDNPPPPTREQELAAKLLQIAGSFDVVVNDVFAYNGHNYEADYLQINGMATNCIISASADPIPTSDGTWTTIDMDTDGITPIKTAFTCAEFLQFAAAFAGRRAANFAVKAAHELAVRQINADPGKTAADIAAYDHTINWII